jgi:putative DNA primase/helicase
MGKLAVEVTGFRKDGGPLTKHLELVDGRIDNDSGACFMARGAAWRVQLDSAAAIADFINKLAQNEAFALGRIKNGHPDRVRVVTAAKVKDDPKVIARTLKYLVFAQGEAGLALIDIDLKGISEAARRRIDGATGIWKALCAVCPPLEAAAYVRRASTSSGLVNTQTGQTYPGSGGFHVVVVVADAADVPRFLSDFFDRLWLAGFGWGWVGGAGQFLERSLIDRAVGSPERLVFEAQPIIAPPLAQAPRPAVAHEGDILDTKAACPPLTDAEKTEVGNLKEAERARLKPAMDQARAAWSEGHIRRIIAAGKTEAEAKAEVGRWLDTHQLTGAFQLLFDDPQLAGATVADVIAAPAKYAGKTLADPLEGLSYGRGRAILYNNSDSLIIHSFAHGGANYQLREAQRPTEPGEASSVLPRFEMRPEGLYRRDAKTESWKWVAPPFEFFGRCREPRDGQGISRGWGRLIRYRDHDDVTVDAIVSDADLHRDVSVLAGSLAEQGFSIASNPAARNAFAEYLNRDASRGRITLAPHTGWLLVDGKPAFILPSGPIGLTGMERERVILRASARAPYETRGSLAEWRDGVGKLAKGNPLAVMAISLAFASTLLWLGGYESGGVHVWGPSSVGKTTLARLNASVWGKPAEGGWLRPWRTTANAIEATLAGACDAGLPFDEVAQADAASFAEMIYLVTGGQGKSRLRRDASLRETTTWRALVLSTGEFPIEIKLGESAASRFGGGKHRGGQSVRLIDIKAERQHGAFDDVKGKSAAEFVAECNREATMHYGSGGPSFVKALIERGVTGADVRAKVAAFVQEELHAEHELSGLPKLAEVSGQAERVAERFGLIAAAGELATEFGVTPWDGGEAAAAAADIFEQWLDARGGANPHEERQAVQQARLFFERFGDSRFDSLEPPKTNPFTGVEIERRGALDRAGWRDGEGEDRRWYVSTEVWGKEVCAGLDPAFVAKTLVSLGILETDPGRVTKVKWRFGKAIRFYVVTPRIFEAES